MTTTRLAIRAAKAFDGENIVDKPTVLVENQAIAAVELGNTDPPEGYEVVDLPGATLVPGLIDAHVHLAFDSSEDPVAVACDTSDDELLEIMRTNAKASLDAGVTTVRDLGDRSFLALRLRADLDDDPTAGAHVLASGPPLTAREGHLHYFGGVVEDIASARESVRVWKARGVDVIKVVASGGELTPGTDPFVTTMPDDVMRAIVEEAHEQGLQVTVHAHSPGAIALAVESGADGIEHGMFLTPEGLGPDQQTIDRIREARVVHCPTIATLPGTVPNAPRIRERIGAMRALLGRLHEQGVRLIAGSDAGIAASKPHGVLPHGVQQFVDVGFSNLDALRATTSETADALGLANKGRLAPGKDADILAVRGDPMADATTLLNVEAVFRSGVRVR
jgi:imidazolonepropionase-like amidohydrolase